MQRSWTEHAAFKLSKRINETTGEEKLQIKKSLHVWKESDLKTQSPMERRNQQRTEKSKL